MSVVHPYQPTTPQRIASEEEIAAMHAKLARKVNGGSRGEGGNDHPPGPHGAILSGDPQSVPSSANSASSQPSGVGESPKEKSALIWNRPTTKVDTAVKTNCQRYCCCKVTVNGKVTYELWFLVDGGKQFTCLERGRQSFEEIRRLADGHHAKK